MQIPTYKQQSVTPQPIDRVMEQPNLAKEQRLAAWGDVVSNGLPKAAMAIDEAYQKEQDFKFGLIKDDMDSNAQQALDGLKDELNKQDPKELFTNGTFDDYTEPYENAMAKAKENSTGNLKGGMKRRADRYWQQLESANRDIARQIYDKAQKEAGAYCAGQDLQSAVEDCDQARANDSIDNAVGAGYMTWQEGEQAKQDAKYDIFINGVISGKPFEYEKKDGEKVAIQHEVGQDYKTDMEMLETAREELPTEKYRQLRDYVNHLWDVKAKQIADDRGNLYIDYYKKIMDKDPSVTLETIENDAGLDPVNLEGCRVDYKANLRKLWKEMNPTEKDELDFESSGDKQTDYEWLLEQRNYLPDADLKKLKSKVDTYWKIQDKIAKEGGTSGNGKSKGSGSGGVSETEIKNFINLAYTRFVTPDKDNSISGEEFLAMTLPIISDREDIPSATEAFIKHKDEIITKLPSEYQKKASDTMDKIATGLNYLIMHDSTIPKEKRETELENLKKKIMGRLLDVCFEYSTQTGREKEFDDACFRLILAFDDSAIKKFSNAAIEATRSGEESYPEAIKKLNEFKDFDDYVFHDNYTGKDIWYSPMAQSSFEQSANVVKAKVEGVVGHSLTTVYDTEKGKDIKRQKKDPETGKMVEYTEKHGESVASVHFIGKEGDKYIINGDAVFREYNGGRILKQVYPPVKGEKKQTEEERLEEQRQLLKWM